MNMKNLIAPALLAVVGFVGMAAYMAPNTAPAHIAEATDPGPVVAPVGSPAWVQRMKDRGFIRPDVVEHRSVAVAPPAKVYPRLFPILDKAVSHLPAPAHAIHARADPFSVQNWIEDGVRDPSCRSLIAGEYRAIPGRDDEATVGDACFDLIETTDTHDQLYAPHRCVPGHGK